MAPPRPKDRSSKDLPENLYESKSRPGYFRYRNPMDGEWHTVGRIPRRDAISQAIEANLHVAQQQASPRLVDRLTGAGANTVSAWLVRLEENILSKRKLATTTRRSIKAQLAAVRRSALAPMVIDRVEIRSIADFLKTYTDQGKDRMALALWSFLKDAFAEAIGAGWIPSKINPVVHTTRPTADVKRARLTLEAFQSIYAAAGVDVPSWVQPAMRLALVSAQRREDLSAAEFKARDKARVWVADDRLWIQQEKTKAKVCLPLALRLDAIGCSLEEAIADCRDRVVSPWLMHHSRQAGKARPGVRIMPDGLSRGFKLARDRSGLSWPAVDELGNPQTPPTFHEIRSLSARLYEAQGNVDVQVLLGHKDPSTTAVYKDARGAEWQELKLG